MVLNFATGSTGAFVNGDSITYLISGISGLSASDFAYESSPGGGSGPFYAAAHIQGIGADGTGSAWVAAFVPEPGLFGVAAVGSAGAFVVVRRRRKA